MAFACAKSPLGDPIKNTQTSKYTVDTIRLSNGVLQFGNLNLEEWGVVPYESGQFETSRWLEKPSLWDQVWWFFKTAKAPVLSN